MARLWQDGDYIDVSPLTDKELDIYSDNSVANGIVTKELNKKANSTDLANVATSGSYNDLSDKPVVDSTPTKGSNNLITSGGVEAITTALNNNKQHKLWVSKHYTITIPANSSATINVLAEMPIDCGICLISVRGQKVSSGGSVIYGVGYFVTRLSKTLHNAMTDIVLEGHTNAFTLKCTHTETTSETYDVSVLYPNWNYSTPAF